MRVIAEKFKVSASALYRHKTKCVSNKVAKFEETQAVVLGDRLLQEVEYLHARTREILDKAMAVGVKDGVPDLRVALAAINTQRDNVALTARMTGRLDPQQDQDKKDSRLLTWEELKQAYETRIDSAGNQVFTSTTTITKGRRPIE